MTKPNKYQEGLLKNQKIDAIKNWLDNEANASDVNDLFIHIWPVNCDMDAQGITTCSTKSNEKCLTCKHNSSIFEYWRIEDNYKPF